MRQQRERTRVDVVSDTCNLTVWSAVGCCAALYVHFQTKILLARYLSEQGRISNAYKPLLLVYQSQVFLGRTNWQPSSGDSGSYFDQSRIVQDSSSRRYTAAARTRMGNRQRTASATTSHCSTDNRAADRARQCWFCCTTPAANSSL